MRWKSFIPRLSSYPRGKARCSPYTEQQLSDPPWRGCRVHPGGSGGGGTDGGGGSVTATNRRDRLMVTEWSYSLPT